jgi:predicted thioesterase
VRVDETQSAHAYGNEGVHVLGTPALVGLIEDAALKALLPHLRPGQHSVGSRVDVQHLAPTPIGCEVAITAQIEAVEGRRVRFVVEAHDSNDEIARGTHTRVIVDSDRFADRVAAKTPR